MANEPDPQTGSKRIEREAEKHKPKVLETKATPCEALVTVFDQGELVKENGSREQKENDASQSQFDAVRSRRTKCPSLNSHLRSMFHRFHVTSPQGVSFCPT